MWVAKARTNENPDGRIISELICGQIADSLELSHPRNAICRVPSSIVPKPYDDERTVCACTEFIPGLKQFRNESEFREEFPDTSDEAMFYGKAVFDFWVGSPTTTEIVSAKLPKFRGDLNNEVDGAHVDAQLQRRRRDNGRDVAALEAIFDHLATLARYGPVVSKGDLFSRFFVDRGCETLGEPTAVDENQRRTVLADEFDKARMDRRPNGAPPLTGSGGTSRGWTGRDRRNLAELRHVLHRDLDRHFELLPPAGVDNLDRPRLPVVVWQRVAAAEESRGLFD